MTETRREGNRYGQITDVKEIAKQVKKEIKNKYKDIKISARTKTGYHQSIRVTLKLDLDEYKAKEYNDLADHQINIMLRDLGLKSFREDCNEIVNYLKERRIPNKEALKIKEDTKDLLWAYNYDDSDIMTDYFEKEFFSFVDIELI